MNCIKGNENLKLQSFWKNFDKLLSIPHPSYHEVELVRYLKTFAGELGLEYRSDEAGNLMIRKPASKGKENNAKIVLQAHLDMVPQKNIGTEHDFLKDPIKAFVEDGWIKTYGTTLGADNGTGVASMMTILEDKSLEHGHIEALFTVEEEVGLGGAGKLEKGFISGDYMINLDGGPGDNFIIGCAGGVNTEVNFEYEQEELSGKYEYLKLSIKGLKGGHSADVLAQRGNANKILFRILYYLNEKFEFRLSDVDSGGLRNAIPREGYAVIAFDPTIKNQIIKAVKELLDIIKFELKVSDSDLDIIVEDVEGAGWGINRDLQSKIISAIHVCHNGLIRLFDGKNDTVQTSVNMASVKMLRDENIIKILFMTRSAVKSLKDENCSRIDALFSLAGAESVTHSGNYPGWLPPDKSELLEKAEKVYKEMFGEQPSKTITHGGLECGIIGSLYPGLEMISMGPNIKGAHSPDEKLEIASMEKNYKYLVKLISEL